MVALNAGSFNFDFMNFFPTSIFNISKQAMLSNHIKKIFKFQLKSLSNIVESTHEFFLLLENSNSSEIELSNIDSIYDFIEERQEVVEKYLSEYTKFKNEILNDFEMQFEISGIISKLDELLTLLVKIKVELSFLDDRIEGEI